MQLLSVSTYIRPEVVGVPEEGVKDLPRGHDDNVDGEEDAHHQEQLRVLHHLQHVNMNTWVGYQWFGSAIWMS